MEHNQARILRGVAGVYLLSNPSTGFRGQAVARGLFRKTATKPLPGDLVRYCSSEDPDIPWLITEILPRQNELRRPPLANLDQLMLVSSAVLPRVDYHYLDRMICYAVHNQIRPLLVLTKCDLPEADSAREEFAAYFAASGFPFYFTGWDDQASLDQFEPLLADKFTALAGQSGVGKSTLMNRLLGDQILETGALSDKAGRGKQTTRSVEIYALGSAFLADTPGFQAIDIQNMGLEPRDLVAAYPELQAIAPYCRFADCKHLNDLGCAKDQAQIHPERFATYQSLRQALEDQKLY